MSFKCVNLKLTTEAWADIVVKEWLKKAKALDIHPESPLNANRFAHHVITHAYGDPRLIEFTFDYYLKFVNWGAGRGVTLDNRDSLILSGTIKRRPKPWYDDVFYKQLKILSHLLAEKYSKKVAVLVKTTLEENNQV